LTPKGIKKLQPNGEILGLNRQNWRWAFTKKHTTLGSATFIYSSQKRRSLRAWASPTNYLLITKLFAKTGKSASSLRHCNMQRHNQKFSTANRI
jgi:hypothetical protein